MAFRPAAVVHFKNGEIEKGFTDNFSFFCETFDLVKMDKQTKEETQTLEIRLEDLKAVFFVKDFDGNPDYQPNHNTERYGFGDRVEVVFQDDETLVGYTTRYKEDNKGFILYPADPKTNNDVVAVIRSAARSIHTEEKQRYFYS